MKVAYYSYPSDSFFSSSDKWMVDTLIPLVVILQINKLWVSDLPLEYMCRVLHKCKNILRACPKVDACPKIGDLMIHSSLQYMYCKIVEHETLILRSLHSLPIRARIQFTVLTLVFKCLHGNVPAYPSELIKQYQSSRNLRSQSKNLLSELCVKSKTFGDRVFEKMAPKLWNNFPKNIKSITDFDKFTSMLIYIQIS